MTVPHDAGDATPRPDPDQRLEEPGRGEVTGLLSFLDGLEAQPLAVQVERLDEVRKGLDAALARPATGDG